MTARDYAEVVVNIEAPLEGTFHYHIPADLRPKLEIGQLIEVEFGHRLAQAIVIAFAESAPVEDTKPVIAIIDPAPVVRPWQIDLALWMSDAYLTPLNACMRLMLPPGLTRWSDNLYDLNPNWDGKGRLTDLQQRLVDLLGERGPLRGRQIARAIKGEDWSRAAGQLTNRDIVRRASVLDAPRVRPKEVRTVELAANCRRIEEAIPQLGRASKAADILVYLASAADPLPVEEAVLGATGAGDDHLAGLIDDGLVARLPAQTLVLPVGDQTPDDLSLLLPALLSELPEHADVMAWRNAGWVRLEEQAAALSLAVPAGEAYWHALRLQGGEKYGAVLDFLAEAAFSVPVGDVYAATGATLNHLRRLSELDLVRLGSTEVWRDSLADRDFTPVVAPALTADQARVWGRIKIAMLDAEPDEDGHLDIEEDDPEALAVAPRPFLLHGVTGSGKTEIYMRAIEFALSQGHQAVVLVPEIALTPQTVRRFAARFPGRVALLHSQLSDGERFDTWRRARQGMFDIVIGPRSALFTPLEDIGVIVLDEEHDSSYKQSPPVVPPYYHARETAVALAAITGATVIMGSATPDVVTYHQARAGRYQLLELPKRIMGHRRRIESQAHRLGLQTRYLALDDQQQADPLDDNALTIPLPPIQIVDMRQELRAGNRTIFSRALDSAVSETLERGEQAILFLNRRGSATFVNCRDCGHVMKCPRCDIPYTYHKPRGMLVCHQCGRSEVQPPNCPNCGSDRIRYFGLGTEKLEEQVQARWPGARVVRWDRDTTAGHEAHEELLAGFINREADILVGTQMIAKGLDLPFVTLVGVVLADVALGLPDYRAGERTFQVLAQVAGRAGRGLLGGRVIVQTYRPEHYAISAAAEHDYAGFYVEEIRFRTRQGLPPFRRLARMTVADPISERARRTSDDIAQALRRQIREEGVGGTQVLGPTPPYYSRLDGRYRWHVLLYAKEPGRLLDELKLPPGAQLEIDPENLL